MYPRLLSSKLLPRQAIRALPLTWAILAGGALAQEVRVPVQALGTQAVSAATMIDGVVQPVRQATVSAQASGRVASLLVKAGDHVRAGQLLATIDDRETQTGVQRGNAAVAQAQAELHNAQAQFNRTRELQSKGFVSSAALDVAEAQLKGAHAGREQAGAVAAQAMLAQGFTRVGAPFDGWVQQTLAEAGDLAFPGKPLLVVYAPQPLRVVVQMPGTRSADARAATQTRIELDSAGAVATTIVPIARQIIPSADPVSQTSEWRWDLAPKDAAALIPGQPVQVQFTGVDTAAGTGKTLMVPTQAIVRRGELTAVYVAQGKGFALRAIRTGGQKTAQSQEVIAGLRPGDVVALDPVKAAAQR